MEGKPWSESSAALGALVWSALPWLPIGSAPSFGSIEHVFLFLPLVAAPLALAVLSALRARRAYHVAQRIQPAAAAMLVGSFLVTKGILAACLVGGWLIMALAVAGAGVRLSRQGARTNASLVAAHVFLVVGAVWLILSRLGIGPSGFSALTVFLAAVHFHFSGFTLQILIAATERRLKGCASPMQAAHRYVALGSIGGLVVIAVASLAHSPVLKLVGVGGMVFSVIGLAITSTAAALASPSPMQKSLLLASAASVAVGMVLAGVYGLGELAGSTWMSVPQMVKVHGLCNAVGFALCGLLGHLRREA
jgi:hypothetical protein